MRVSIIANTGKSFEILTQKVFQAILDYDDPMLKTIAVEQNKIIQGITGTTHQIDVYWEFERAGIKYQTLVEVKDWKSKVKQDQIQSFHSVLRDIPGQPTGIFVSKNGFQRGAKQYAKTHGIELAIINQDTSCSTNSFRIFIDHYHTRTVSFIAQKPEQQAAVSELCSGDNIFNDNIFLFSPLGEKILASYFIEQVQEEQQHRNYCITPGQWTFRCNFLGEWKISCEKSRCSYNVLGFDVQYSLTQSVMPFLLNVESIPKYIVTYVINPRKIALYPVNQRYKVYKSISCLKCSNSNCSGDMVSCNKLNAQTKV